MLRCSVVMPHFENHRTLLACLRSFTSQQSQLPHEVVVVDDGSKVSPAHLVNELQGPVPIKLLTTQRAGQSGATNAGILAATGEVVLLTCADILATPHLVAEHMQAHAEAQARGVRLGVGGHIAYAPWIKMTPFMRFLSGPGPQFDFANIQDPNALNPASLYAPNVSVGRQDLLAVGGFDPGFPYGFQDTDLGLRLAATGVHFVYRAKAKVLHDHPNDLPNFLRRNRHIGAYIPRMLARYPDPALRSRCRNSILDLIPLLKELPLLVATATKVEEALGSRRNVDLQAQEKLFTLYQRALGMAFVQGLVASGEQARRALGFDVASWERALAPLHRSAASSHHARAQPAAPC